jgi:(p)ppGpp synthase/HD superfamily hydrolase
MYSVDYDRALALAAIVHRAANRKGTRIPYAIHPVHVAVILQRAGCAEPVQIAGLLHDVLEDVDTADGEVRGRLSDTFPELGILPEGPALKAALADFIARRFSPRVRQLVEEMTQRKHDADGTPVPIQVRRQETVVKLEDTADRELVALKAADALHNASAIAFDLRQRGAAAMQRFKGTPRETVGYYLALGRAVERQLGVADPLACALSGALQDLSSAFEHALTRTGND